MNRSTFALSPTQQGLWFAHMQQPHPETLQCAELLSFDAAIDSAQFSWCIQHCLSQVEVIQARYNSAATAEFAPTPIVVKQCVLHDTDVQSFAQREIISAVPVQLSGETLTKHWLIHDTNGQVHWLARFHHIVGDGMFLQQLLQWICATYTAKLHNASLPDAPFARLEEVSSTPPDPADLDYWQRQQFHVPPPVLEQPAADTITVHARATLPAQTRTALRQRLQRSELKVVELEVFLAATAHYVSVVAGTTEAITLGLPVMHRRMGAPLVQGPTVNVLPFTLPLDADGVRLTGHNCVATCLQETRQHSRLLAPEIRRLHHELLPHEPLHGPDCNYRPFVPRFVAGNATATLRTIALGPIHDLEFVFQSSADGGLEIFGYAQGSNRLPALRRHIQRLAHLIQAWSLEQETAPVIRPQSVSAADDGRFSRYSCALPEERNTLQRLNDTSHAVPAKSLVALFSQVRATVPGMHNLLAHIDHAGQLQWLSMAQVWQEVETRATRLERLGVGPGVVVAVHLERSLEFVLLIAAIVLSGGTFCPIDPTLPAARRAHMLTTSQARVVITDDIANLPPVTSEVVVLTPHMLVAATDLPQVRDGVQVSPTCSYILFTSGSTGTPKAVMIGEDGIVNRLAWMVETATMQPTDTLLHKTPSSFDVSVWEYLLPFTHGIPTVIAPATAHRDPERIAALMIQGRISIMHSVPSALKSLLAVVRHRKNQQRFAAQHFALRTLICSGEVLEAQDAHAARNFFTVDVLNYYGPAEASIDVTAHTVTSADTAIPIGQPVWNTQIAIIDQYGQLAPLGVSGELLIGGVQVGLGYLGQPALTAKSFVPAAVPAATQPEQYWYRTGDKAYWDHDTLWYQGRGDTQVKLHGQRFELGEVEAVLTELPEVLAAVAVLREIHHQRVLMAYLVVAEPEDGELAGGDLAGGELAGRDGALVGTGGGESVLTRARAYVEAKLPGFMVPTHMLIIPKIPVTANGKLDRDALPLPSVPSHTHIIDDTAHGGVHANVGDENPALALVLAAFENILGISLTDPEANFFALGGTSLSAVELALALDGVSVADVFATSTPAGLAALITQSQEHQDNLGFAPLLELQAHTHGPMILCLAPAGGLSWSYAKLVTAMAQVSDHNFQGGIYGFQSPGILEPDQRVNSIQEQAAQAHQLLGQLLDSQERKESATHTDAASRPVSQSVVLIGWSVGGVVAHELAHRLHTDPRFAVLDVILLDAYPPHCWQHLAVPQDAALWQAVLAMAGVTMPSTQLELTEVLELLQHSGGVFGALRESDILGIQQMVSHNAVLLREHVPSKLAAPILHIAATADKSGPLESFSAQAWEPYVGEIISESLAVSHPDMVSETVLTKVAQHILDIAGLKAGEDVTA